MATSRVHFVLENPWLFAKRVVTGFSANQGFLLSGAVAYYTLLTIIPMFALILVALSQIQETQPLLETLRDTGKPMVALHCWNEITGIHKINWDLEKAGYEPTNHLIKQGRKKIIFALGNRYKGPGFFHYQGYKLG